MKRAATRQSAKRPPLSISPEHESPGPHAQTVSRDILRSPSKIHTNVKFQFMGASTFGRDAPKFTIGSSRRDETPPIPLPGPGEYNVPDNFDEYRKIKHTFPKSNPKDETVSPTANIDFVNIRDFPAKREAHIGVREKLYYANIIDSPGPTYLPQTTETRLPHRIISHPVNRTAEKVAHLGPGCYNPNYAHIRREPAFFLSGPKNRHKWMEDGKDIPGPGSYNTDCKEMLKREPKWTIGRKSRPSRRMRNSMPAKPKDLIAVDQCIVDLSVMPNPDACRQYIIAHPDIRYVVGAMLHAVFLEKPEDPVEYLISCVESWNMVDYDPVMTQRSGKSQTSQKSRMSLDG